jgi:pimeloyl-ACP methyl ester carboxylesterase
MSAISTNGTVYEISGPVDAPVLVFVHGLGLNRQVWEGYISRFAQRYRVLNYDLFGHGESPAPPGMPSLTMFSEQLLALLDELSIDRCSIIGFSLGGMINRRFADTQLAARTRTRGAAAGGTARARFGCRRARRNP